MHQKLTSTLSQYNKIILVGWGTGGHIQPIVSLVHSLDRGMPDYLWIWWSESQEEKVTKTENIEFQSIPTLKLATTRSWRSLLYPIYLMIWFWRARQILCSVIARHAAIQDSNKKSTGSLSSLRWREPLCLFSKWWPWSVAIGLAAWSLSIPLYIHESDTIPGRSNRILGKIATRIFLGFEYARIYFDPKKCEVIGQILDPVFDLQHSNTPTLQHSISWKTNKPHILVICGSQWSRKIFEKIIIEFWWDSKYEWIISLGKLNSGMKGEFEKIPDCQALEWIAQSDIAQLIQDTDLAITRWSATTLAELTSFRSIELSSHKTIKLIIIPLPYSANNHQHYNALEYQKMGHVILEQKNLDQFKQTLQQYGWYKQRYT